MKEYLDEVVAVLPDAQHQLALLRRAVSGGDSLRVAVYGKFNHGKSTLLNALIGKEVFKISDRRETTKVSSWSAGGVEWIDTPGLDAAVDGSDDRLAAQASLEQADVLLVVHSVREGELDQHEQACLQRLFAAGRDSGNVLLVLAQVEQPDPEELERIRAAIAAQLPQLSQFPVSAQRHASGKPALVERSGIGALRARIDALAASSTEARAAEARKLVAELLAVVDGRVDALMARVRASSQKQAGRIDRLHQEVDALNKEARRRMKEI